jgi:hypothetical protein
MSQHLSVQFRPETPDVPDQRHQNSNLRVSATKKCRAASIKTGAAPAHKVALRPETGRPRAFANIQRSLISQMYRPTKGKITPPIVCKQQTPGTVDQILIFLQRCGGKTFS